MWQGAPTRHCKGTQAPKKVKNQQFALGVFYELMSLS